MFQPWKPWYRSWAIILIVKLLTLIAANPSHAQIVPDDTLGSESSRITRNQVVPGGRGDRISGGAIRGFNLFHSFSEFNIEDGKRVYFTTPNHEIQNIFSRVTGINRSDIEGTLGVDGDANLFFLNPNGIIFGRTARIDVSGSFVATTANAIQFGNLGRYSASPDATENLALLTINPSALLFNQITPAPVELNIRNRRARSVPSGRSFLIVGGPIELNEANFFALGGWIELAAVLQPATVGLDQDVTSDRFRLNIPDNITRGNISLDRSSIDVSADNGGNIILYTNDLLMKDSSLTANVTANGRLENRQSGQITINAIGIVELNGSDLTARDGSNIAVQAQALNMVDDSAIRASNTIPEGPVNNQGGDIVIHATGDMRLTNGSKIDNEVERDSIGLGGDINIHADTLSLFGRGTRISTALRSEAEQCPAQCRAGNIDIQVRTLDVTNPERTRGNGSVILSETSGLGDAGNIRVVVGEGAVFDNRGRLNSRVLQGGRGNGGQIELYTGSLTLRDVGLITAGTEGEGDSGRIVIQARDTIHLINGGLIQSNVGPLNSDNSIGVGNGNGITIEARSIVLMGGSIESYTNAAGQAGSIRINASDSLILSTFDRPGRLPVDSRILAATEDQASGQGGYIDITTGSLQITGNSAINARSRSSFRGGDITINAGQFNATNGGQVVTSAFAQGNAGDITINAAETTFSGSNPDFPAILENAQNRVRRGNIRSIFEVIAIDSGASGAFARTTGDGKAGNITLNTPQLTVQTGARLTAETNGSNQAGAITLQPPANGQTLTVNLNDGQISASTSGTGRGGNLIIQAPGVVNLQGNGKLNVETTGAGRAGDIAITTEFLNIRGAQISATTTETATASAQSGNISVNADRLNLAGIGAGLFAETRGTAAAGNITLQPRTRPDLTVNFRNNTQISTSNFSAGQGGRVTITAPGAVILSGRGRFLAQSTATGNAGNVRIDTDHLRIRNGTEISTSTSGSGQAGDITIRADSVALTNRARIRSNTQGQGGAGRVIVRQAESVFLDNSSISTTVGRRARVASRQQIGSISVQTRSLSLTNNASINASTAGEGDAGNITVRGANTVSLANSAIATAVERRARGQGGSIVIQTTDLNLTNGARVAANSNQESRNAGNIAINASGRVDLSDSDVTTSAAARAAGGAIDITAARVELRDGDIRTNVSSGAGGGGNITIAADSILAFDDSDILAFAADGRGGNITLDTSAFLGENYQPAPADADPKTLDGNDRVDVNASGAIAGVITLPDQTFIQNSLSELPDVPVDPDQLIANSCIARNPNQEGNFTITGAGGLPMRPETVTVSPFPTGTVQDLPATSNPASTANANDEYQWQSGDPIVEPQGVYRLPNGRLVMSRECS